VSGQRENIPSGAKATDAGFLYMDPIPSAYGGEVDVRESSAAMGPHLWMRMTCPVDLNNPYGEMKEAVAHLRLNDALRLAAQITTLAAHHFQTQEEWLAREWPEDDA
jgi:hypothetical protein